MKKCVTKIIIKAILSFLAIIAISSSVSAQTNDVNRNPFRISDLSSPRSTLESFLHYTRRAHRFIDEAQRLDQTSTFFFTSKEAAKLGKDAEILFRRATTCLDFSHIPPAFKKTKSYEKTLKLKEILDRVKLPPFEEIPDAAMIEKEREEKKFPKLHRWRIPQTDIIIDRVEEGHRKGQYLFTSSSVEKLDSFYTRAKSLPYQQNEFETPGFFEFYSDSPGRLLPPKWFQWLPEWTTYHILSQTIWQWFVLFLLIAIYFGFVILIIKVMRPTNKKRSPIIKHLRKIFIRSLAIALAIILYNTLDYYVNITGSVLIFIRYVLSIIWWTLGASIVLLITSLIADIIIATPHVDSKGIQASYYRAIFGVIGFVIAAVVLIFGLARIGVAITPLLTGVGIGGLAIAMAARPTLESIISSFIIFADKPYEVGQRVSVMGHYGEVEAIGLRSTRIRLLNGQETSIPNEKAAASEIVNIERRPYIRRDIDIKIPYNTNPEKINKAIEILNDILAVPNAVLAEIELHKNARENPNAQTQSLSKRQVHPNEAINVAKFPPRVFLNDLQQDALNIKISYWYHPPKYWLYMAHAHEINLAIIERFNAAKIEFAFPTQTIHLEK